MKRLGLVIVFVFSLSLLLAGFAAAADDSKVKDATNRVESGAKKIPDGTRKHPPKAVGQRFHRRADVVCLTVEVNVIRPRDNGDLA